ncbi:hypothetical protein ACI65C_013229 [Semiaphis heraclei]
MLGYAQSTNEDKIPNVLKYLDKALSYMKVPNMKPAEKENNKVCASPKIIEHISDGVNLFRSEVKIDIDFEHIYPSKGNSLFVNWDQFVFKIIPLMITNIKDGNSKLLLKRLVEIKETDIETRNHLVLDLMNALLVPTSKSFEIDPVTNKRRVVKTSISDAKTSFLLQVVSANDLHVQIQSRIDNAYKKKEKLTPFICIVGADDTKDFYVYYFDTYYKLPNIVRALLRHMF